MSTITRPVPTARRAAPRSQTWIHVASHLDPRFGGVAKILPELCAAVSGTGECNAPLVGFCDPAELKSMAAPGRVHVECVSPAGLTGRLAESFGVTAGPLAAGPLSERLRQADGVHIHGLWEQHCVSAVRAARAARKPYVLSAHGMLEPWALRNKRWKKIVYSWLVERSNVSGAACLHALTRAEAENYRSYGAKNPIAVIPNGVHVPGDATAAAFLAQYPALGQKRCVLFLGRIHYKKGLNLLVQAWKQVAARDGDAHLVLAGPDFENTQASVERTVAELGLAGRVTFTGMLSGDLKWSAIQASEIFVLPSYSEGFSVSVLEAMGMGKPVVVTRQCNVPEVSLHGCGWVIEPDAGQLASSLLEYLRMPGARVRTLGANGRSLVEGSYNWTVIGAQMRAVYEWVPGGPVPGSVELILR
jgi:glycosyltransferase involved in cell wall biosynthesis